MVGHALDQGYEVVGVCREKSVGNLDNFEGASPWFREERPRGHKEGTLGVLVPTGGSGLEHLNSGRSRQPREAGARFDHGFG
jgi:hypothetical protein